MNEAEFAALNAIHSANSGNGFAVGEEGQTPTEAAESECWEILWTDCTGTVACKDDEGRTVIIADAEGPWAVVVEDAEQFIETTLEWLGESGLLAVRFGDYCGPEYAADLEWWLNQDSSVAKWLGGNRYSTTNPREIEEWLESLNTRDLQTH